MKIYDYNGKKNISGERIKNARFNYVKNPPDVKGRRILLVDDIVTTGASLGNSAALIRGLHPKEIVGVALSVAYRDKFVPFANESRF